MNGQPLMRDGRVAAVHRRRHTGGADFRSNMTAGATTVQAQVTPDMLRLAERVRPRLVRDGMFLIGLDIAGDQVMEINVFSPSALPAADRRRPARHSLAATVLPGLEDRAVDSQAAIRHGLIGEA